MLDAKPYASGSLRERFSYELEEVGRLQRNGAGYDALKTLLKFTARVQSLQELRRWVPGLVILSGRL